MESSQPSYLWNPNLYRNTVWLCYYNQRGFQDFLSENHIILICCVTRTERSLKLEQCAHLDKGNATDGEWWPRSKTLQMIIIFFKLHYFNAHWGPRVSCACTITIFEVHISGANIILNYTSQSLSNVSLIHVQWQEKKKNTKIDWQQCLD